MATDLVLVPLGAGEGRLGQVVCSSAGLAENEDLHLKAAFVCSLPRPGEGDAGSSCQPETSHWADRSSAPCAVPGLFMQLFGACGESSSQPKLGFLAVLLLADVPARDRPFLCPLQEKLSGESCRCQRGKTGCCTSRTRGGQPDSPSLLQKRALCLQRSGECRGSGLGALRRPLCPALHWASPS